MKAEHKKLVARATAARKAIKAKTLDITELEADAEKAKADLVELQTELSAIETEAAESGFAVSDMHAAVKL
jgi:predicted  nucleic acid-binding Zn-ribbon protein